jgi:hypothetical protein
VGSAMPPRSVKVALQAEDRDGFSGSGVGLALPAGTSIGVRSAGRLGGKRVMVLGRATDFMAPAR